MGDQERKLIVELLTLYELEPDIKDIFVEGYNDKMFLDWYLSKSGCQDVSIYTADMVCVEDDILAKHGRHTGSAKERVVALGLELESNNCGNSKVSCIVDLDYDHILNNKNVSSFIKYTDYTSLDLYVFTPEIIEKFVNLVLGGFPMQVDTLVAQMINILKDLYYIRMTNVELDWDMKWIPLTRYVEYSDGISFRTSNFVKAYLSKNNRLIQLETFSEKLEALKSKSPQTPRLEIRGHDIFALMHAILNKHKKSLKFGSCEIVRGAFIGCVESTQLDQETLFSNLIATYS